MREEKYASGRKDEQGDAEVAEERDGDQYGFLEEEESQAWNGRSASGWET